MIIFFFNDTATTEIYTLSLHDALPISRGVEVVVVDVVRRLDGAVVVLPAVQGPPSLLVRVVGLVRRRTGGRDRKSTRLNSSHANISYAVFCLKKKILLHSTLPLSSPLH